MTLNILAPAAVLAVWSMIVLLWMFASRVRGFAETGIDLTKAAPGARYADIENRMPPRANWKSHNYTHLMEQPTLFYALVAIIALSGGGATAAAWWAWGYTGLRIVHSLWQCLVNVVPVRFGLFALSSLCLFVLGGYALAMTLL